MDINGILAAIGGILGAWGVSQALGRAFLSFMEFWLVGLQGVFDGIRRLFELIGGLFAR